MSKTWTYKQFLEYKKCICGTEVKLHSEAKTYDEYFCPAKECEFFYRIHHEDLSVTTH